MVFDFERVHAFFFVMDEFIMLLMNAFKLKALTYSLLSSSLSTFSAAVVATLNHDSIKFEYFISHNLWLISNGHWLRSVCDTIFYFKIVNMCLLNDLPREKFDQFHLTFCPWRSGPDHVKIDSDHTGSLISNIVRR